MKLINSIILLFGVIAGVIGQKASSCYKPEAYSRYSDKGAITLLPDADMLCSSQGLTLDLCETMEIKLIELRDYPRISFNGTISITFYTDDESEFITYQANVTNTVKGPSQFFHTPEKEVITKVKRINIIFPDVACGRTIESDEEKPLFFAFIGRITEDDDIDELPKIVTDKDYAEDELDRYCNNEVDTLPLNFLTPSEFRNSLFIDLQAIIRRSDDYLTKFGMAIKLFMKQKTQEDINNECRGYLYVMQFNRCDIARTKHADYDKRFDSEFKPIPKYITDVVRNLKPETLPKSLTQCVRDLEIVNSSE